MDLGSGAAAASEAGASGGSGRRRPKRPATWTPAPDSSDEEAAAAREAEPPPSPREQERRGGWRLGHPFIGRRVRVFANASRACADSGLPCLDGYVRVWRDGRDGAPCFRISEGEPPPGPGAEQQQQQQQQQQQHQPGGCSPPPPPPPPHDLVDFEGLSGLERLAAALASYERKLEACLQETKIDDSGVDDSNWKRAEQPWLTYIAKDNETAVGVAARVGCKCKGAGGLVEENHKRAKFGGGPRNKTAKISANCKFIQSTVLLLPPRCALQPATVRPDETNARCDVCKQLLKPTSLIMTCEAHDWDVCGPCHASLIDANCLHLVRRDRAHFPELSLNLP